MKLAHFFIDRPVFSIVSSLFIAIVGGGAFVTLPVAQYPEIAPPTIQVTAAFPGASAQVLNDAVATPLEDEINGVENMLYVSSQSAGDGKMTLTVTFRIGTNLDVAQVLTQNRVSVALPRLPEEVQRLGVSVRKNSPDMLMVIHLYSPDNSRDRLYMSNYATLRIRDVLSRVQGASDVQVFGGRDYSMRIWLDPDRLSVDRITAGEVVAALRAQNIHIPAGVLNQPPTASQGAFQPTVRTTGRLVDADQFLEVIVKSDGAGRVTRLKDVARVELGAQDYGANGYLDSREAVPLLVFQQPGSNALATAERLKETMRLLATSFPEGLSYDIVYNPTEFIQLSIREVLKAIYEATGLVVIVIVLFLKNWRASIIPIVAIPISLIGSFTVMAAAGVSINSLSLFGLVLAVGIVVDDAIVVVENVERHMREGLNPRDAAHRTIDEAGGALIAIATTLAAVFVPTAFMSGIAGQFFRQFAMTMTASTLISLFVSLFLSPALCAVLLRPHDASVEEGRRKSDARRGAHYVLQGADIVFSRFDRLFDSLSVAYGRITGRLIRVSTIMLAVYATMIGLTAWMASRAPTGFIPQLDQGYLITVLQMPPGSSLARTDAVVRKAAEIIQRTPGVRHAVPFAGFDGATSTNASNAGTIFSPFIPFDERVAKGLSADVILADLRARLSVLQEAFIVTIPPPPVPGVGTSGGFKMMIQDKGGHGPVALEAAAQELTTAANQIPGLTGVFSSFNARAPNVFADIDRKKAEMLGVSAGRLAEALQIFVGSQYVNDFNYLGRTYHVMAQADAQFRSTATDLSRLKTRNDSGAMVSLGSIVSFLEVSGPYRIPRHNLFPAAEVQGSVTPEFSSSYALAAMERLATERLPLGFGYEWTELSYQEKYGSGSTLALFAASTLFVFLVLAAQYESWTLPAAVVLIAPMCLLTSIGGLVARNMAVDIFAQIGFIVLIGLATKNAILIVEFARQSERQGLDRATATVQAARIRLRPILMTSLAFILGVLPMAIGAGAGAEMRQSLGSTVFFGMIGVTIFGLLFTPVFFFVVRNLRTNRVSQRSPSTTP